MQLIKADHERWLEIPGVPGPVRRPVDIDRSRTGFANLRSLRIYRFDAQTVIDGHAEEDEVFVIVLAGSVEFNVQEANSEGEWHPFMLSAASGSNNQTCVAYLSPGSAYRLTPQTDADVAYARATPMGGRPSTVFTSNAARDASGVVVMLEQNAYAKRLRLRLLQIAANVNGVKFSPVEKSESGCEALIHIRTVPAEGVATIATGVEPMQADSWDTVAVAPREFPTVSIASSSSALVLVVLAV